jgi:Mg2+ and Co2+ transporter CorA
MIAVVHASHRENQRMTDGFASIIDQLERQKSAIERALAALREVDGSHARAAQATNSNRPATKKAADIKPAVTSELRAGKRKKFSAAARRKMALAQKARWAKIKGETELPSTSAPEPPKPRRKISPEGMQRIIAATKKRWRLQRAAAKSVPSKKVAPK